MKKIIIPVIGLAIIAVIACLWILGHFQKRGLGNYSDNRVVVQTWPASDTANVNEGDAVNKKEKLSGDYNWGAAAGPDWAQYKAAVWQPIIGSTLAGFSLQAAAKEKRLEECGGLMGAALRNEGCLCQKGYWVEITKDGQVEKIDTPEKLKNALSPIDSAAKAVSLVTLATRDLNVNTSDNIPVGHVLPISDGYLVQVVDLNFCGCGTHIPSGVIYKVTESGEMTQIAAEIVPPSDGPEICVD